MAAVPKFIPKPIIVGFFLLGVLSSVAFRAVIILQKVAPAWVRPVWYFGALGYLTFFLYRYFISMRRKNTIRQTGIIEKLQAGTPLVAEDRAAALYLLNSIRKSPEDWNYLVIFTLSIVTILVDLLLPGK